MITREYRENRARFPLGELDKYRGNWVAFSADCRHVVASGETVEELENRLAADGNAATPVVLEWLPGPEEDSLLGECTDKMSAAGRACGGTS
jgi:hypothetical protein